MKIFNKIYYMILATSFLVACTDDDISNQNGQTMSGDPVNVRFSMDTRAASGAGISYNPVEGLQVERFNRYWVVFTDGSTDNKVVAIVKNTCPLTERDEFNVTLSPGSYKAYGFANISDEFLESLGIENGKKMPNLSGVMFTPDNRFFGNSVTTLLPVERMQADYEDGNNLGIPMTSVNGQVVNITNAITVTTSIEVVRMFAKIEFLFGNNSATDLTLRSQSISNLSVNRADNKGFIPLCNDDTRDFSFLNNAPFAKLSHTYEGGVKLNKGVSNVSKSFYVLESLADTITNSFMLNFDIIKNGETPVEETDSMRYALTDSATFTAIRRNDWIRIPVIFTDWQMRLEAYTYPPIGGYPEADIRETESNEFIVVFDGGGDFTIRPFIRKFNDENGWFGIDNTVKIDGKPVVTYNDADSIFITPPTLDELGEIRGRMKVAPGMNASITVSANVITSNSPYTVKNLTRKIFVTQKHIIKED